VTWYIHWSLWPTRAADNSSVIVVHMCTLWCRPWRPDGFQSSMPREMIFHFNWKTLTSVERSSVTVALKRALVAGTPENFVEEVLYELTFWLTDYILCCQSSWWSIFKKWSSHACLSEDTSHLWWISWECKVGARVCLMVFIHCIWCSAAELRMAYGSDWQGLGDVCCIE